jgi:hypothetical protein
MASECLIHACRFRSKRKQALAKFGKMIALEQLVALKPQAGVLRCLKRPAILPRDGRSETRAIARVRAR